MEAWRHLRLDVLLLPEKSSALCIGVMRVARFLTWLRTAEVFCASVLTILAGSQENTLCVVASVDQSGLGTLDSLNSLNYLCCFRLLALGFGLSLLSLIDCVNFSTFFRIWC
jgi:hypothetical protein